MRLLESIEIFPVILTLAAFQIGRLCQKKWKSPIFNPTLIGMVLVTLFVAFSGMAPEDFTSGTKLIFWLMTPATISLAVPMYEQFQLLKKNALAILAGVVSGVLTSVTLVLLFSLAFHFSHAEYVTFLPKSVTTAIGMGVSEQLGGNVSITVVVIIVTGVLGNILAEPVCRLFSITNPIARGIGIGSASHAIGTAKAMEMGQIEGAMSGLSIAVSGILTVAAAAVFGMLY